MSERKKLTDILHGSERDRIAGIWESAKPADDLKPIPSGEYRCRIIDGYLFNARSGTAGYKLTLEVLEGEHAGRRLWHDIWLTEAAASLAKRDLGKLGVASLEQLERPLPDGILIDARVALRRGDDGTEFNRVSRFDVVGIEPAEPEPFAPGAESANGSTADAGRLRLAIGAAGRGCRVMTARPHGFRVAGHRAGRRRLIDWRAAFAAYAACDPTAQPERESYLSHFTFGADFAEHLERNGSEAGFNGLCGADWLFWDIDRPGDLASALSDARRLTGAILDRYRELDDNDLLVFLSGGKGMHVGIPTALWGPSPCGCFHETAKRFALAHGERAGVVVDGTIYSKTRLFRAPNSRHPKTGLFKRRLALDELMHLKPEAVVELARHPEPFRVSRLAGPSPTAAADWLEAGRAVGRRADERRAAYRDGGPKLTATTLTFIRDGATDGERALQVFRAAANLAEFDCPSELAHALLTEAALDSGLTPGETKRQIESGLAHARRQREGGAA